MTRDRLIREGRYRFLLPPSWPPLLERGLPPHLRAVGTVEVWDVKHDTTIRVSGNRWTSPVNALRLLASAPLRGLRYGGGTWPWQKDLKARTAILLDLPPGSTLELTTRSRWSGQVAVLPLLAPAPDIPPPRLADVDSID